MRFVVQRVTESEVKVDGEVLGKIGKGFMVLIGVSNSDTKEIADKMSFNNEYYFNTFFKKYFGMTPGEYKKIVNR